MRLGDRWELVGAWLKRFDLLIAASVAGALVWWIWRHTRPEAGESRTVSDSIGSSADA
jgi:hypothetical protein